MALRKRKAAGTAIDGQENTTARQSSEIKRPRVKPPGEAEIVPSNVTPRVQPVRRSRRKDASASTTSEPADAYPSSTAAEMSPLTPSTSDIKAKGKGKAKQRERLVLGEPVPEEPAPEEPTLEKRLKRFRNHPPQMIQDRLYRCERQRMFVLERNPMTDSDWPEEQFTIAGTTGNVYTAHIGKVPTCNCPDAIKNGQCKHILYIMTKVLKAPTHLVYQAALLSSELKEIFDKAPNFKVLTEEKKQRPAVEKGVSSETNTEERRKPLDEDDCPICYCPFENGNEAVWCRAACGSNMHKECFMRWAATKKGGKVTCVMCRSEWVFSPSSDSSMSIQEALKEGRVGEDGYLNVANQLGISSERDWDIYGHESWTYHRRRRWHF